MTITFSTAYSWGMTKCALTNLPFLGAVKKISCKFRSRNSRQLVWAALNSGLDSKEVSYSPLGKPSSPEPYHNHLQFTMSYFGKILAAKPSELGHLRGRCGKKRLKTTNFLQSLLTKCVFFCKFLRILASFLVYFVT